jgi:hypothetical protein
MNELRVGGHVRAEENPDSVSEADLVIGLYSVNDAANMDLAVEKAAGGAARYRPDMKTVLLCSDLASTDGTKEAFFKAGPEAKKIYVSTSPEERSKRNCFFNIVETAARLKARAVIFYESRISTIKKTWLPRLLDPILENGAVFTSPLFSRQLSDLPITYILSYPMFRALFGRRIRNPHLGDFAFSGSLNEVFLNTALWPSEEAFCSVELTIAMLAVSKGPVFQSFMGDPRVGLVRLPLDTETGAEFCKSLKSFYELMLMYPELWKTARNSRPTPVIGADLKPELLPPREVLGAPGQFQALIASSARKYQAVWEREFPKHMDLHTALLTPAPEGAAIAPSDWADLLYTGAVAFKRLRQESEKSPPAPDASPPELPPEDEVVQALMPAFLARFLNFKRTTILKPPSQTLAMIESECVVFEKAKPWLLENWGD